MNPYFQNLIKRSAQASTAIRPRLPSLFEAPDSQDFTAIDDLEAESIRHPEGKTRQKINHSDGREAIPGKETKSRGKDIRKPPSREGILAEEAFSGNIPRGNANPRHIRTGEDSPSPEPPHHPRPRTTGITTAETANVIPVSDNTIIQQTTLTGRRLTPASPERQPSAIADSKVNQILESRRLIGDEAETTAEQASPMDRTPAGRAPATDFKQASAASSWLGRQSNIQPNRTAQTASGITQLPVSTPGPKQTPPEETIKVTIGRIDVRAVMPQTQPSTMQTVPKAAQPEITLEDYLKKQRGGSR